MAGTWHYLSFVQGEGEAERFAGACVVRGDDVIEAVREAHRLGCNPGGEVLGAPIPPDKMPPERYRERLLTRAECDECWDDCVRLGDVKQDLIIPDEASMCTHQNAAVQSESVAQDQDPTSRRR